MNNVEKVLSIAEADVGYLEKKSNSQLDDKTANAGNNNYTKYWRELAPGMQGQPWCNCAINYWFVKAYGESEAKKLLCTDGGWSYYTPTSAGFFKNKGQYFKSNPKVGDIIYFKNSTRICHVGIVYKVDASKVYTIEGNTSGASGVIANGGGVCKKSYSLTYKNIDGYGRPNYTETPKENEEEIYFFDADFYSNKYADIKKLLGTDKEKLWHHFQNWGKKEGRRANLLFNPRFYAEKYPDLKKAFGTDWEKYYIHFLNFGMKEKRQPSEDFIFSVYKERYPDLRKAFGEDTQKYYMHFCLYGVKEGRKAI